MAWTPIWRQAHTKGMPFGLMGIKNKTVVWEIPVYTNGSGLRIAFANYFGKKPCMVAGMAVLLGGTLCPVTIQGQTRFAIGANQKEVSDEIELAVKPGDVLQLRLCMADNNADTNMIEEEAVQYKGNLTMQKTLPPAEKPQAYVANSVYYPIPAVESVEICTEMPSKVIVAFGDSITAMSRWTKPLAKRLYEHYGTEYTLVNEGISGNCITYNPPGILSGVFGECAVQRYKRDVSRLKEIDTVIFAIGTNDFSYAAKKNKELLSAENVIRQTETLLQEIKKDCKRLVGVTLTPRFGYFGKPVYDDYMNAQRVAFNTWMRSSPLFDYVMDADMVVRSPLDPNLYDDRYHQGDHLHPNAAGGVLLAESFNLEKLTGKEA